MKRSLLVGLIMGLLAMSTLSGCIWVADDDGYRRDGNHEREHWEHHGDHDRYEEHGDHR